MNILFVDGKTASTAPSAVYMAHGAVWRPFIVEFTATRLPSAMRYAPHSRLRRC